MSGKEEINPVVEQGPPSDDLMTVGELKAQLARFPDNCKVLMQILETLTVVPLYAVDYGILKIKESGEPEYCKDIVALLVGQEVDDEESSSDEEPEKVEPAQISGQEAPEKPKKAQRAQKATRAEPAESVRERKPRAKKTVESSARKPARVSKKAIEGPQ